MSGDHSHTYVALPNPLRLSAVGTVQDANGNNVLPFYFPYDEQGNVELYYLTVESMDGQLQFTREAWPNLPESVRTKILALTHPMKTFSGPDLTQLAGGAAYSRFTQTILWLETHEPKTSRVKGPVGTADCRHNRTVRILKARNAKGTGFRLAFEFNSENLTLNELGVIVKGDQ